MEVREGRGLLAFMRDVDMNAVLPFEESLDVAVGEAVDESLAARWEETTKLRSLLLLLQEAPQLRARWLEEASTTSQGWRRMSIEA
jgi:hypothetical protein